VPRAGSIFSSSRGELHLSQLKEQMALQQQLYARLEAIATRLQSTETISIQEFIQLIEATTMTGNDLRGISLIMPRCKNLNASKLHTSANKSASTGAAIGLSGSIDSTYSV
jgi:hypothetical protein